MGQREADAWDICQVPKSRKHHAPLGTCKGLGSPHKTSYQPNSWAMAEAQPWVAGTANALDHSKVLPVVGWDEHLAFPGRVHCNSEMPLSCFGRDRGSKLPAHLYTLYAWLFLAVFYWDFSCDSANLDLAWEVRRLLSLTKRSGKSAMGQHPNNANLTTILESSVEPAAKSD